MKYMSETKVGHKWVGLARANIYWLGRGVEFGMAKWTETDW